MVFFLRQLQLPKVVFAYEFRSRDELAGVAFYEGDGGSFQDLSDEEGGVNCEHDVGDQRLVEGVVFEGEPGSLEATGKE